MSFFQPHPPPRPSVEWVTVQDRQAGRQTGRATLVPSLTDRKIIKKKNTQQNKLNGGQLFITSPSLCWNPQGLVFCSLHRLPEQHGCLFDHQGHGRQEAVQKVVKLRRKVGRSCQRIGEEFS